MVNIEASEWENVDEDWNISGIKVLNVSDLEVSITDFNGARISFTSNMPVVKVMPQLYVGAGGLAAETGVAKWRCERQWNHDNLYYLSFLIYL